MSKQYKLAFLIPATSNNREWKSIQESDMYKILITSFIKNLKCDNLTYKFFFGIDREDKIYDNIENQQFIIDFLKQYKINIDFIHMDIEKGYLSKMWNKLFKIAYDEGFDYFYQCGDDIDFIDNNFFKECIDILKKSNDIGVTGPYTHDNTLILTQSLVSRKHMEIFGFYFPEEIRNWFIDDWITFVYQPKYYFPLLTTKVINSGGDPRYDINRISNIMEIVNDYKPLLNNYIAKK